MAKKTISSVDTTLEKLPKAGSQKASNLVVVLVALCLVFSLLAAIFSIFIGVKVSKFDNVGSDLQLAVSRMGLVAGEPQEDDVTIADKYTVRSTKDLSDAYKAGKESGLDSKQKETLELVNGILGTVIKDDMTPYEQELAVYKWMTKNLEQAAGSEVNIPVSTTQIDEPYGVLKTNSGAPVGFATTFRMFMECLDIPCKVVHDTGFTTAWNEVQLDDEWYHVDTYADAAYANFENFNMNDAICAYSHNWDTEFFPVANGTEYCYALMKAKDIKDIYTIPTKIKKMYDKKQKCVFLRFKASSGKDLEIVDELVSRTADYLGGNVTLSSDTSEEAAGGSGVGVVDAICMKLDDDYLLGVFFNTEKSEAGLTTKDYNKISKAVEKAFPGVG